MTATRERSSIAGPRNVCVGWEDEGGRFHKCTTDDLPILAKGRCTRCYSRARTAERAKGRQQETAEALGTVVSVPSAMAEPEESQPEPGLFALFETPVAEPVAAELVAEGYAWVLFDQPPHIPPSTEPRISIVKDGNCRINGAAYALWGREVTAVEILHDRRRGAIALRPCDPALAHARQLRPDKRARSCSLRAFKRATGLLADQPIAGRPTLVGTMLVLDIHDDEVTR